RHAQKIEEGPVPPRITFGQVVVYRDQVSALALQGVEIQRHGGYQGLALTSLHLRDLALVQNDAPDNLNIEVAHGQLASGCLPHHCKGFGEKLVKLPLSRQILLVLLPELLALLLVFKTPAQSS